jgi:hypothetical protein
MRRRGEWLFLQVDEWMTTTLEAELWSGDRHLISMGGPWARSMNRGEDVRP